MSPDSNPVKRFRSLSGSPGDSNPVDSDKKENEPIVETPASLSKLAPLPNSYSAPKNNTTEATSHLSQKQVSDPPGPPPWNPIPITREQHYEPDALPRAASAPVHYVAQSGPSPDTAYIIELIGGLLGFFGLGYLYAGETGSGTTRLIIGILCNVAVGVLAAITAGIFACLVLPIYIVVAVLSATSVRKLLINRHQQNP